MKRCKLCHRFGVEFNPLSGKEECIWHDCSKRKKQDFSEFAKSIKQKTLSEAFKESGFIGETSVLKINKKVHRDVIRFLKRKDADEKRSLKTKMRFD